MSSEITGQIVRYLNRTYHLLPTIMKRVVADVERAHYIDAALRQ